MRNNIAVAMLSFAMIFGPTECDLTTINSTTSLDGRKVKIIFCSKVDCDYFDPGNGSICYCCPDYSRREYCHLTREECRANCALCRPKC
ncbi:hypothetical protein BDA96_03G011100 [Sorghum bicolor]|uniref:Embryo surrounding factor 1 brassicaceae domain-containing protein n=2 Tax=Sorghum bicolor TaxID=4558 RepID=A0A921ULC3_SORBI|nr:hypothetical protein BDA96_03G011100 [Sorghum bicolor]OQU86078.1 hypothetical protein SORBI_3003G010033 [Sorghum bicolor]